MVKYKKKLSALLAFSLVWSASIRTDITASEIVDETKKESKITTQKLLPEKETIKYAISKDDIPELVEDALLDSCEEKTKANAIELENAVREYKEEGDNLNCIVVGDKTSDKKVMYTYAYPVKYKDNYGKIKDISLDVKRSSKKNVAFETKSNDIITEFSQKIDDGIKLHNEEVSIEMYPCVDGSNMDAQTNDFKTVTYEINDNTSYDYALTYCGFKEDIVVEEYDGVEEYEFIIETNGLHIYKINGSYCMVDEEGKEKATIGDIIIFTADEKNNSFGEITVEELERGQRYKLVINIDGEYLKSKKTKYPIRIDPTVEITSSSTVSKAILDLTINSSSTSNGTSGSLYVGYRNNYGISRVLMSFPGLDLSPIANVASVTSATVEIRDLLCQAESMPMYCYAFCGAEWGEASTWGEVKANSYTTQFSNKTVSYGYGETLSPKHRYSFNITKAVKGWILGNYDKKKGIIFKTSNAKETSGTQLYKAFASYNRSEYKPSVKVVYTNVSGLNDNNSYCINNGYYGSYMQYKSSALTRDNDLLSNLGTTVNWRIRKVDGGYVVYPTASVHEYLAAEDNTSAKIILSTINYAEIPNRCKWTITKKQNADYTFKNVATGKYLCLSGATFTSVDSMGTSGTVAYNKCIWRIYNRTFCEKRELTDFTPRKVLSLVKNEARQETYGVEYNVIDGDAPNARPVMTEPNDFAYSIGTGSGRNFSPYTNTDVLYDYNSKKFKNNTTNNSIKELTVRMVSKVTKIQCEFNLIINPQLCMFGLRPTSSELKEGYDRQTFMNIVYNHMNNHFSEIDRNYGTMTVMEFKRNCLYNKRNNVLFTLGHGNSQYEILHEQGVQTSHVTRTGIALNNAGEVFWSDSMEEDTNDKIDMRTKEFLCSNLRLIVFAGCNTADVGDNCVDQNHNLLTETVGKGADCAVGFQGAQYNENLNQWYDLFIQRMASGSTVEEAINKIKKDNSIIWDKNSVTINQVEYKGNGNVKLVY